MKNKATMPNKFEIIENWFKIEIENWWQDNDCYDRERASGIPYIRNGKKVPIGEYLEETDDWWAHLSLAERKFVYCNFVEEE